MPRRNCSRDAQRAFKEFKEYYRNREMTAPERSPEPEAASSSQARDPRRPYNETVVSRWSIVVSGLLAHHVIMRKTEFHKAVSAKWDQLDTSQVRLDEMD